MARSRSGDGAGQAGAAKDGAGHAGAGHDGAAKDGAGPVRVTHDDGRPVAPGSVRRFRLHVIEGPARGASWQSTGDIVRAGIGGHVTAASAVTPTP